MMLAFNALSVLETNNLTLKLIFYKKYMTSEMNAADIMDAIQINKNAQSK